MLILFNVQIHVGSGLNMLSRTQIMRTWFTRRLLFRLAPVDLLGLVVLLKYTVVVQVEVQVDGPRSLLWALLQVELNLLNVLEIHGGHLNVHFELFAQHLQHGVFGPLWVVSDQIVLLAAQPAAHLINHPLQSLQGHGPH